MYRIFIVGAVVLGGCGLATGEDDPTVGVDDARLTDADEGSCPGNKVLVCHRPPDACQPHALCVSAHALDAHLAHGDFEGPCASIGTPPRAPEEEPPPSWTPQRPKDPVQLDPEAAADMPPDSSGADWTPQRPKDPVPLCVAEGQNCFTQDACCGGLECSWGVCLR